LADENPKKSFRKKVKLENFSTSLKFFCGNRGKSETEGDASLPQGG